MDKNVNLREGDATPKIKPEPAKKKVKKEEKGAKKEKVVIHID